MVGQDCRARRHSIERQWCSYRRHGCHSSPLVSSIADMNNTSAHSSYIDPPDSIPIAEFMSNEKYGRHPIAKSRNPFTCGLTGKTFTVRESIERREHLARAISKRMGWFPNEGTPWDKVIAVFSFNTVSDSPDRKLIIAKTPLTWTY